MTYDDNPTKEMKKMAFVLEEPSNRNTAKPTEGKKSYRLCQMLWINPLPCKELARHYER